MWREFANQYLSDPPAALFRWRYENGFLMQALAAAGRSAASPALNDLVEAWRQSVVDSEGHIMGYAASDYNLDNIQPGQVLWERIGEGDGQCYAIAIRHLIDQLRHQPRTTSGGYWHKQIYPNQMWLDGIYMAAPLMVRYGLEYAEPAWVDEAWFQIRLLEEHVRNAHTGLLHHGWDESGEEAWADPGTGRSSECWGRGIGWFAMALVDILALLPSEHAVRAPLARMFGNLCWQMALMQDQRSGLWWQVVDRAGEPGNYEEASVSAMMAYVFAQGVRLDVLDAEFAARARRAYTGIHDRLVRCDRSGIWHLTQCNPVSGLGGTPYRDGSYAYYVSSPVTEDDSKAVAALILAGVAIDRLVDRPAESSLSVRSSKPDAYRAAQPYLAAVQRFAERVLVDGRDRYGSFSTPLLVDGVEVASGNPVRWQVGDQSWVLSNLGSQQILFRTLDGLTQLTGQDRYRNAAQDALGYGLTYLRHGGLISLGGHMAVDLNTKQSVYAPDKGPVHELKCHYPYYELMWSVSAAETARYIEAIWQSHILDWDRLEFSRHGRPAAVDSEEPGWDRPYCHQPAHFTGVGLTFINAGSDLIYAAGMLSALSGDERPRHWAERLAERYVDARDANTGLGGYQFSRSVLPGKNGRGDRAEAQFGQQLSRYSPTEATLCVGRQIRTIVGRAAINKLLLAERLGAGGQGFATIAVEDLLAFAEHSYDPGDNSFHPLLTNGVRLTGLVLEQDGYYGRAGGRLEALPADFLMLWAYLLGYRASGHPKLWSVARTIALANGLGDIGVGASPPRLERRPDSADPLAIFCLLELFEIAHQAEFLSLAQAVADQLLVRRVVADWFVPSVRHRYAKFDAVEPIALLHLAGTLLGRSDVVPRYPASQAFFGSAYGDRGHTIDNAFWYQRRVGGGVDGE